MVSREGGKSERSQEKTEERVNTDENLLDLVVVDKILKDVEKQKGSVGQSLRQLGNLTAHQQNDSPADTSSHSKTSKKVTNSEYETLNSAAEGTHQKQQKVSARAPQKTKNEAQPPTTAPAAETVKPAAKPKPPVERFHAINFLRIWWTFWIIVFHFLWDIGYVFANPSTHTYYVHGDYGVECFFVLSGFVLTMVNLDRFKGLGMFSFLYQWFKFFVRRLVRLYPIHLLTNIILYYYEFECPWPSFWLEVSLSLGWSKAERHCSGPSWFVHMEVYCCFFMPLVLLLLSKHWLFFLPFLYLIHKGFEHYISQASNIMVMTVSNMELRAASLFSIGIALGYLFNLWRKKSLFFDGLLVLSIYRFWLQFTDPQNVFPKGWVNKLVLLLLIVYSSAKSVVFCFLADNIVVSHVAEWCFGGFLLQWPVIKLLKYKLWYRSSNDLHGQFYGYVAVYIFITLFFSMICYYTIEERIKTATEKFFMWFERKVGMTRKTRAVHQ